ncbi:MAG: GTPase HflX [Deltaproteobacteria bacterium HGW-Deltaproteobacteria-14]|jgi:GTP-binding protein HflX|nr:MAG: GTPase HflX [Deltaproteobacteria bacterium HGW-Deltaproteobacteria-14]
MAAISGDIRRQVGVILDRRGHVQHVIVGDADKLQLPDLGRQRAGKSRFRGVRLIHTHVLGEGLNRDDLTDLSLLQLDVIGVLQVGADGHATTLELAHLIPPIPGGESWEVVAPTAIGEVDLPFTAFIEDLEAQFRVTQGVVATRDGQTRAIAVHITDGPVDATAVTSSLLELQELARTAGVTFVDTIVQRRRKPDPKFAIGQGKLEELVLATMHGDADLVVFDQDLTPAQARSIAEMVELKVIDRTQLILDIFATRATSKAGKLQVELAQLKYSLPRLAGRNTALSRLAGGIGGRGPGETKLEIDRRRAKDRINTLQKRIEDLGRERQHRRRRRTESELPVVAIVGYTNAGKSTLLNTLTGATVLAEDKLFATLDPTTRRLRFPNEVEIVLTDTVGFIRDLPEDLVAAFKATLEELAEADILLHVVDIATDGWEERMDAVERILRELEVHDKPVQVVFNQADRHPDPRSLAALCRRYGAIATSAIDKQSLRPLTEALIAFQRRNTPGTIVYAPAP